MHEPPRILLVDENEANLDVAKMWLESQGYEVITAGDGEEALARVRETGPDLVLLDIMMPKLDGIEVTRCIKADASLPFIPIILVTAKADAKDVVAGLDAGGDDYLTKPFDPLQPDMSLRCSKLSGLTGSLCRKCTTSPHSRTHFVVRRGISRVHRYWPITLHHCCAVSRLLPSRRMRAAPSVWSSSARPWSN